MSADHTVDVHTASGVQSPLADAEVEAAVQWVLEREGVADAELSVALVGDEEIAALNRQYLDHEGPTDVISFPLTEGGPVTVGDIYIGVEQARRQALELAVPPAEEILRLAMHGTLHVLGYDHPEGDRDDSPMYQRQEALLREFLQQGRP